MTLAIMAANAVAGGLEQRLGTRAVIAGGALLMAGGAVALRASGPTARSPHSSRSSSPSGSGWG